MDGYDYKKVIYDGDANNTPKTMTEQERYRGRNREKCLEKGRRYYAEIKERLQKMAHDQYRGLSEEEKNKKKRIRKK